MQHHCVLVSLAEGRCCKHQAVLHCPSGCRLQTPNTFLSLAGFLMEKKDSIHCVPFMDMNGR